MTTLNPALTHLPAASTSTRAGAAIAFLFGAFIVLSTGFAGSETIHNATHDTRHAFGLPCH